jgi:hypothetical protein
MARFSGPDFGQPDTPRYQGRYQALPAAPQEAGGDRAAPGLHPARTVPEGDPGAHTGRRGSVQTGTIAPAGEVLVNLGGEPDRDDFGLPPVDIVVPDDARELDRDVQAYHRELRALRRKERRTRLHGPLTRDGVILPLLASCLVLALVAGTLLTLFSAMPSTDLPGAGAPLSAAAGPDSPTASPSSARLPPRATVELDGQKVPLSDLTGTVLALVPASCDCSGTLARLVRQAHSAGVAIYLVGGGGLAPADEVTQDAAQASPPALAADDPSGVLAKTFLGHGGPAPGSGPRALLVPAQGGPVRVTPALSGGFELAGQLTALRYQ